MHIYHVPSGEVAWVINLRNARIDTKPPVLKLIGGVRGGGGGGRRRETTGDEDAEEGEGGARNIWAVYGSMNTWLFRARSEREMAEWVLAVDEGFVIGGG